MAAPRRDLEDSAILEALASGKTRKEIASNFSTSEMTISTRLRRLCDKYTAATDAQLVLKAKESGDIM